jgi:hypothetical protein
MLVVAFATLIIETDKAFPVQHVNQAYLKAWSHDETGQHMARWSHGAVVTWRGGQVLHQRIPSNALYQAALTSLNSSG